MQLEQGYVVVQSLAVVVVVDVCGGYSEGLSSWTSELLGQVVVSHPHVDGIASPHNAEKKRSMVVTSFQEISLLLGDTVGCSENPGAANLQEIESWQLKTFNFQTRILF